MSLHSEICEQPVVLDRLLKDQWSKTEDIARMIRKENLQTALLAGRGTSDNVCRYAGYLWGARNRILVALAMPSLFSLYQQPPIIKNTLVVGISQSGRSPDIVSVLKEGRNQGVTTVAITNDPLSPLSLEADYSIDILAGEEKAVAATKTYTAQLLAIAMISCALDNDQRFREDLARLGKWVEEIIDQEESIKEIAYRHKDMEKCVVLGRGINYASTFEWALKIKELSFVSAEPYSSADFQHGPVAVIEKGFPILVMAPNGKTLPSVYDTVKTIKETLSADIITISNNQELLSISDSKIALPLDLPEWMSPIPGIVAGQIFAYHLTCAKGLDPENPRTIKKVTETF